MAVGEKTLDQFTGTGDRPTPFTLYFLRNPNLSSPQSRKQSLRVLYEAIYDALVVEDVTVSDPTTLSPSDGEQWIVSTPATGSWDTHDNQLAIWDNAGSQWVFATPTEGWRFYSKGQDEIYLFDGSSWIVDIRVPDISGHGGEGLRVNSGATGIEFVASVVVPALTNKGDRLRVNAGASAAEWTTGPKAGTATIADAASSESVAFSTAFPDANYSVSLTAHAEEPVWISNKAAGGFDINRNNSSGTDDVDWIAVPHEDL